MRFSRIVLRAAFLSLLIVATATPRVSAQNANVALNFQVNSAGSEPHNTDLELEAVGAFEEALEAQGATKSDEPDWMFHVRVEEGIPTSPHQVAVSVAAMYSLPEAAIQWGRESEIAYGEPDAERREAFPEGGTWVRQLMSEEYFRAFGLLQDLDVLIVERAELQDAADKLVRRFFARHSRQ